MSAVDPLVRALLELTRPLASERRGGVLDGALEHVVDASRGRLAVAFTLHLGQIDVAAEHAHPTRGGGWRDDAALVERVRHTATRVTQTRRVRWDSQIPSAVPADAPATRVPHVLATPIMYRRNVLGALAVVVDSRDDAIEAFVEHAANVLGLAMEIERCHEREVELKSELVGAGRLASLGVLLTTLAHELQGPLNALAVQTDERRTLLARLAVLSGSRGEAGNIAGELTVLASELDLAVARLSGTVARILSLGRQDSSPDVFDLSEPVRDAVELCRADFARRGITVVDACADGAAVRARRDEIGQVVMNLLRNAADAVEHHAPEPRVVLRTSVEQNRSVFSIEDNGPGVSRSAAERIFESFYTTKPRGKGTGLGLKICRDVIAAHGGHIEVSATPGAGATFRVFLPRVQSAEVRRVPESPKPEVTPELPPTRPEVRRVDAKKILLIDDDDILSRALRRALRPHDVRLASSAEEASMILVDPDYTPDVVLCDLRLPGISGDELHRRMLEKNPSLARRFAFVTGGAFSEEQSKYLRDCGCPTLLKPVSVDDVLSLLAADVESARGDSIPTLKSEDG
jgi:signal transduction histidine kinase/ActR/RegA family two-component response regulator